MNQPAANYDSAVNEAERRLLNVTHGPTVDLNRLRTSPSQKSPFQKRNDETESLLESPRDRTNSVTNLRDINAMSVASVYDGEHNEIDDADK